MARSVLAVIAGLLSLIILTYMANMVVAVIFMPGNNNHALSPIYFGVIAVFIVLFGIIGGFITASVSNETPQRDIAILSAIVFLLWIISSVIQFERQSIWYSLLLLITLPMAVLAGGQIKINKFKREEESQYK